MCGIGGWLGTVPGANHYAGRMANALIHRGPDEHGIWSTSQATLVHTRLSIIDLSPAGAQPLSNEDRSVWVVFNGEIYNHRELRKDLKLRGHTLIGHSDAQVIPHLYEEYGYDFPAKLSGMYAIALFDTKNQKLLLVRDRFGIKPLFYASSPDRLAFASEIGALRTLPGIDDRVDKQALYDFVALSYIPAPATFYTSIRALEPGTILQAQINAHEITSNKISTYHKWSICPDMGLNLAGAADRGDALITAAVRRQMESDVPLGTLLSGGIDSSLVSAAAQKAINGGELRTFSVRFSDAEYDETWAAMETARSIGSHHQVLDMVDGQGTWDHVSHLLRSTGQPFADTSLFAVNAVCRMMRQHVTVALSGDGGDEGFGGYDLFWQLATIARRQLLPSHVWRQISLMLSPLARSRVVPKQWPQRANDIGVADDTAIIQGFFCETTEEEQKMLCQRDDVLPARRLFEPTWDYNLPKDCSRLERLSAHASEVNIRLELANDFLFKVDKGSMNESLEVRVPLLDEELFGFALTLPHHLKVKGRKGKRVLREIALKKLPPAVANKPKRGFGIPVDKWVDLGFRENLREALLGSSSKLPDFFRPEAYRPIIESFCSDHLYPGISRKKLYQRAIMLLSVQLTLTNREFMVSL